MSINWVTFIAQILNFLILAVLLYFVLFRKIIQVMDARQKRMEDELNEAKLSRQKAEEDRAGLEKEKDEMQRQKSSQLTQIHNEVDAQKISLLKQSQEEVEAKKKAWESDIDSQKEEFFQNLRKMAGVSGVTISRQMMKDLAGIELQEIVEKMFVQKLQAFLKSQKPQNIDETVVIASAFPMSEPALREIGKLLEQSQGKSVKIETQAAPELLLGVELKMKSAKIAWNIDDYLQKLQEKVDKAFSEFETK